MSTVIILSICSLLLYVMHEPRWLRFGNEPEEEDPQPTDIVNISDVDFETGLG